VFSGIFSRKNRSVSQRNAVTHIEGLEDRLLMTAAPKVIAVTADNRGEVTITLSRTVTGVSKSSVKLFAAGPDGITGTEDDVREPFQAIFTPANNRITIKGNLPANTGYRVRIQSSMVQSLDGRALDGEFLGTFPTGDGHPGGNFAFAVKNDKSASPVARLSTSMGTVNIVLDETHAPKTVQNFLGYANIGKYDELAISRAISNFIVQMGGLNISPAKDKLGEVVKNADTTRELNGVSNLTGTVAFAHSGADVNSQNEFFFNLADNTGLDNNDNNSGGPYAVFAKVRSNADLQVMQNIANLDTVDLFNPVTGDGVGVNSETVDQANVPVTNAAALQTTVEDLDGQGDDGPVVTGGFDANAQVVVIRRTAILDKIVTQS
jgi:cyclophilin family peptidyl-prolyl cis-trans isomerase